jgi:hypothetical protein
MTFILQDGLLFFTLPGLLRSPVLMEPKGYVLHLAGRIQAAFSLEEP